MLTCLVWSSDVVMKLCPTADQKWKKIWSRMLKLTKNPVNFEDQQKISFSANRLTGTINVMLQDGCVFLALRFPILPFMAPLSHGLFKIYFGLIICCQKGPADHFLSVTCVCGRVSCFPTSKQVL